MTETSSTGCPHGQPHPGAITRCREFFAAISVGVDYFALTQGREHGADFLFIGTRSSLDVALRQDSGDICSGISLLVYCLCHARLSVDNDSLIR